MLRVIPPLTVTDAMVVSLSESETDAAAWSSGTTYAAAAQVVYAHRIYESLQASNTNHQPDLAASSTWWLDTGPTNAWAMFDGAVNTATVASTDDITVVLAPTTRIDTIALVEVSGASVSCVVTKDGATIYSNSQYVAAGTSSSWYEWFFGERGTTGDVVFEGIPPYTGQQITITVTGASVAQVGVLVMGRIYEIGTVELGAEVSIADYSTKVTDAFGTTTLSQGAYARRPSYPLLVDRSQFARVFRLLESLRATPCLWLASTEYDTLGPINAFGWYRDFRAVIPYRDYIRSTLEIEGLI